MGDKVFTCIFYICIAIAIYAFVNIDKGTQFFLWGCFCLFIGIPILGLIGGLCEKLNNPLSNKQSESIQTDTKEDLNDKYKNIKESNETSKQQKVINKGSTEHRTNIVTLPIKKEVKELTKNLTNSTLEKINDNSKISLITEKQKCALLKIAIELCYSSPERLYLWRGQYEILLEFTKTLKLEENQLNTCIQAVSERFFKVSETKVKDINYYEIVKSIYQDEPFIQLINTCVKLLDFIDSLDEELIKTESYAYLVFPEILEKIGFTKKEIEDLKYGEGVYRTRDGKNIIVLREQKKPQVTIKQKYPVSKEQMAIFRKNWTLPQFRKEFGIEKRIKSKKGRYGNYKVCIFVRNIDNNETEVGFSNSLGYPTIEEIQKREKELMVGLSVYGNYKLYDDKIKWESESLPVNLDF